MRKIPDQFVKKLLKVRDQFGEELYLRENLNIAEMDGKPCAKCGKIPLITKKKVNGKWIMDRSSRVDCDSGDAKEKLETYCYDCWKEKILETGGKSLLTRIQSYTIILSNKIINQKSNK